MDAMTPETRNHVHALIDQLPPVQLAALETILQSMLDPFDDEPYTEEDRLAVAEADEWRKHNDPIPLDNVLADFALTMADWETMSKVPLSDDNDGWRSGIAISACRI